MHLNQARVPYVSLFTTLLFKKNVAKDSKIYLFFMSMQNS